MDLDYRKKSLLHQHYLTMRNMLAEGFPRRGVQKSFEELVYSVMSKNSWRPTHISKLGSVGEVISSRPLNIEAFQKR